MYRVVSRAVEQPAMHAYYSFGRGFDAYEKRREACAESADARRTQEVYPQRLLWYPGSGEGARLRLLATQSRCTDESSVRVV